ncbi:endonuclease MutS2 [Cytobacillus sp. FJAT-54145]|uniref:Endonuclease MutS2 n=1 Tax=Cytobacillus spartinae TaxID=3299023 RepID=A0ABW6K5L8_9BACI
MNLETIQGLEFTHIKERIAQFALSEFGRKKVFELAPSFNQKQIQSWLDEVTEGVQILKKSSSVPVHGLDGIEIVLKTINKGVPLKPELLSKLNEFLDCCEKMRRFMKDKEFLAPRVTSYIYSTESLPQLSSEINRCIRNGQVDDYASKELSKIRKQISIQEERLKEKLNQMIKSSKYKSYLQESVISQRDGRFVIPVKKEYKAKIKGAILDQSASGSTVYIEPEEITSYQEQLSWLRSSEEAEVDQILFYLTGLVEANQKEINLAVEIMVHYDVLFAKAKYSKLINGKSVNLNQSHYIHLIKAKHPLLGESAVPLTIELGRNDQHALVITGPNTGGKTVTLKTVGLLTLMIQSGIHIPVEDGSSVSIFQNILLDIGDGQSIEQNLSTFSSRIKNIINILTETNDRSLVLLDELGSGTDPAEGMGLATAILEQIYDKGSTLLATTHYSEIKEFANQHSGFVNGSMEFDLETLKPTYRLIIGKGGESQAFAIALKLGMHPKILEKAHFITYKEQKSYQLDEFIPTKELEKQIIINKHLKRKQEVEKERNESITLFNKGDNVVITQSGEYGIVYKGPDSKGFYVVQVKGEKQTYNHKRLKLNIPAAELYPEDYDFDIIFESKENRKIDHALKRKHIEGLTINRTEEI